MCIRDSDSVARWRIYRHLPLFLSRYRGRVFVVVIQIQGSWKKCGLAYWLFYRFKSSWKQAWRCKNPYRNFRFWPLSRWTDDWHLKSKIKTRHSIHRVGFFVYYEKFSRLTIQIPKVPIDKTGISSWQMIFCKENAPTLKSIGAYMSFFIINWR